MGVIKRGILGGFSGSVGSVVGTSWKGIEVMKSKPLSVANPRTAGQVAQRSKMSNVVALATVINASTIKPLWDRFAVKQSGYNAFVQANIDLFASIIPSPAASFILSKGKMTAGDALDASGSAGDLSVLVSWSDFSGEGYKLATDEAYAVVIRESDGTPFVSAASSVRSDVSTNVVTNALVAGQYFLAYLAFRRADGTIVSDTNYVRFQVTA